MLEIKRTTTLFLASAMVAAIFGCTQQNRRPASANAQNPGSDPLAKRFQDTPLEGKTVVESAMELSDKYAKLSDQSVGMRQENQKLQAENEELRQQITAMETKLKQTQKELGEANQLLVQMLGELNNWKTNILGFRGEMREAAKAQLEAMLKVLEILGGEAEAGTLKRQNEAVLHPGQTAPQPSGTLTSKGKDQNEP
jgi:chromosome segregation ATPase